jgi:hypothetical protein
VDTDKVSFIETSGLFWKKIAGWIAVLARHCVLRNTLAGSKTVSISRIDPVSVFPGVLHVTTETKKLAFLYASDSPQNPLGSLYFR